MKTSRFALPGVLVFLWTSLAGVAAAYAQDDAEMARAHYSKGTRLYQVGDYRQALDEFKAAHVAKPDSAFLYNIAQCHRQLGDFEQAVTLYKRYLVASPNAANRVEVERRVAEIEAELAARKRQGAVQAPAPPAPAPVVAPPVLGAPAPSSPAPSPFAPQAAPAPAAGSPGLAVQPVAVAAVAQPEPPRSSLRTLRWIGVGVTAALAGGAIASGLSASSKYDSLKSTCGNTPAGCLSSETDTVKSRALVANILWGLTGVAAVGTGVAFILAPHESAVQVAWRF